jgi:hypothetical protein
MSSAKAGVREGNQRPDMAGATAGGEEDAHAGARASNHSGPVTIIAKRLRSQLLAGYPPQIACCSSVLISSAPVNRPPEGMSFAMNAW